MKQIFIFLVTYTFFLGSFLSESKITSQEKVLLSSAQVGEWVASPVIADCVGPRDASNRYWYDTDFDDSSWQPIILEDLNSIPPGYDRYYRTVLNIVGDPSTTKIQLTSDDGLWAYVNGVIVGHWGGNCHSSGLSGTRLVDITSYLHTGENVIAVHVSNGVVGSGFNAIIPWQISFPDDVQLTAKIISLPECPGEFGIASPLQLVGDTKVEAHSGMSFTFSANFPKNTPLLFYYKPSSPCEIGTYYSDDPRYAKLIKTTENTWKIVWSDYPDWSYGHLIIELISQPAVIPFLELPFDAGNFPSFARAVSDTEKGGTVNAYFDHFYPNYSNNNKVVTFHGFESTSDHPGYSLVYDGHDGIDFKVPGTNVQVLAAADGGIYLHPEESYTLSCYCEELGQTIQHCLGNYVEVVHANGYKTWYAHLSEFAPGLIDGQMIAQGDAIGTMGTTGCSSGNHIHFKLTKANGIAVDPFGWLAKRFPDSTYGESGDPDPWAYYNATLDPPQNALSTYLWKQAFETAQLNNPDGDTIVNSISNSTQITLPKDAVPAPAYRVELFDLIGPPSTPLFPGTVENYLYFAIFGPEDVPVITLSQPAIVRFDMTLITPKDHLQARSQLSSDPIYSVYIYNSSDERWEELVSDFDPIAQTITVNTTLVGQLVVIEDWKLIFMPMIQN